MADIKEVVVPDIGSSESVEIIEVSVAVGDQVDAEDVLITLESDKASMEIPAPFAGTVQNLKVAVGDKVGTGDLILLMETEAAAEPATVAAAEPPPAPAAKEAPQAAVAATPTAVPSAEKSIQDIIVPDLGGASDVTIIEVNVAAGDTVEAEETLITLESEKASMEMPSPAAGEIKAISVNVNDKVSTGDVIGQIEISTSVITAPATESAPAPAQAAVKPEESTPKQRTAPVPPVIADKTGRVYASPSVRRIAYEFGIDLTKVSGTGRKGRILKLDVQNYVKQQLANPGQQAGNSGLGVIPMPDIDFTKFGEVEYTELSRIKKISAQNLHRNWVMIPHVTQFDEVDISEMEAFRQANKADALAQGYKLTPLVFLMKAVAKALKQFPNFNASLTPDGEKLVLKKYFHVGVAVDTPKGLVVPVVRNVDKKGLFELADELGKISVRARELKLTAADMQGACFTISSLGGIGGTAFTPIINAPDVAILGVSKSQMKPIYNGKDFTPKLMLPLSLSYDHRVIDGAEAARFITYLGKMLVDIRRLLL